MAVSAYEGHELLQFLKSSGGPERAETMMNLLPVAGWSEVATKNDLAALETSLRGEMTALRGEMTALGGSVDYTIAKATRLMYFALITSQATLVGLVLAAIRLG